MRLARGIDVNEESLALELIKKVGFSSNYITAKETSKYFKKELFMPTLLAREPYETWEKDGGKLAIDRARERAQEILERHRPREVDAILARELDSFKQSVASRNLEDFYLYETEEKQDYTSL